MKLSKIIKWTLLIGFALPALINAAENPDELYRQGRYAEAEKAYAQFDMDHPEDIRYRYNRGCASFSNSDFQGAMAAFGSVLKRAEDDNLRFKATYNLGNTAFKQGDFESAVAYYKQAITYDPNNEDASYNLELALIKLEKAKKENPEQPGSRQEHQQTREDKKKETSGESSPEADADKERTRPGDTEMNKDREESERKAELKQDKDKGAGESQKADPQPAEELSGSLESANALTGDSEENKTADTAGPTIDKKMAEALLDNIKEDRSRFLRFQVPREKRHGVRSGKDW